MPVRSPHPAVPDEAEEASLKERRLRVRSPGPGKELLIVRAASRLFLKYGYANATMDMIAEKAGVTKQTVYAYFRSKEVLFVRMINDLCQTHQLPEPMPGETEAEMEKLLYSVGIGLLDFFTQREVMSATRLVISETERHPALAQLYYESGTQRLVSSLAQWLEKQKELGRLRIESSMSAASYFIAMLKGQYYLRMILGVKPVPPPSLKEQHARETVAIFMRVYGGEQPMQTRSTL